MCDNMLTGTTDLDSDGDFVKRKREKSEAVREFMSTKEK